MRAAIRGAAPEWRRILGRVARRLARAWRTLFPDRVLRRSMTVSGAVHFALLLVMTLVPAWPRQVRWQSAPLVVSLVSLPAPAPKEPPKVTPPSEKPKPKLKVDPQPEKKPEREAPRREKPPPPEPRAETPPDSVVAPATEKDLRITARVDERQFFYDYYLQIVAAKISAAWEPPAGMLAEGRQIAATLRFRILREGLAQGLTVEEASELALFDRSTQEAILRAQPFPPLPPGYAGRWLTVHLRFAHGE